MINKELINRINELSRKSKTNGLTDEEKQEQINLRQQYLKGFRTKFEEHVKSIKVIDEKGNDVTPKKNKK